MRQDHPTADQVYNAVRGRLPGVSRTTVYRVLDTLVRMGVINRISHPGAAARFDAKVHQHHHLVCLQCGKIIDLEDQRLNELALPTVATQGYRIDEFHIHFRGDLPGLLEEAEDEDRQKGNQGGPSEGPPERRRLGNGYLRKGDQVYEKRKRTGYRLLGAVGRCRRAVCGRRPADSCRPRARVLRVTLRSASRRTLRSRWNAWRVPSPQL